MNLLEKAMPRRLAKPMLTHWVTPKLESCQQARQSLGLSYRPESLCCRKLPGSAVTGRAITALIHARG